MAHPQITDRKISVASHDDGIDAFTVEEFCRRHRISVQMFYKRRDLMPDCFNIGSRVLISREAAARWRQEREAEAAAAAENTTTDTAA